MILVFFLFLSSLSVLFHCSKLISFRLSFFLPIQQVDLEEEDPLGIYHFLTQKGIGQELSLFYESLSDWLESHGRTAEAVDIIQKGIARNVKPENRLRRKLEEVRIRQMQGSLPLSLPFLFFFLFLISSEKSFSFNTPTLSLFYSHSRHPKDFISPAQQGPEEEAGSLSGAAGATSPSQFLQETSCRLLLHIILLRLGPPRDSQVIPNSLPLFNIFFRCAADSPACRLQPQAAVGHRSRGPPEGNAGGESQGEEGIPFQPGLPGRKRGVHDRGNQGEAPKIRQP